MILPIPAGGVRWIHAFPKSLGVNRCNESDWNSTIFLRFLIPGYYPLHHLHTPQDRKLVLQNPKQESQVGRFTYINSPNVEKLTKSLENQHSIFYLLTFLKNQSLAVLFFIKKKKKECHAPSISFS